MLTEAERRDIGNQCQQQGKAFYIGQWVDTDLDISTDVSE